MQTGTYTITGSTVTIVETFACMASELGRYIVSWDATCSIFTLHLQADACADRGMRLDGVSFTRL